MLTLYIKAGVNTWLILKIEMPSKTRQKESVLAVLLKVKLVIKA